MAKVNTTKLLPRSQKSGDEVSNNLANVIEATVVIKRTTINLEKFYVDRKKRDEEAAKKAKREQVILKDKERKLKRESTIEKKTTALKKKEKGKKVSAGSFGNILDALVLLALGWLIKFIPDFIKRVEIFIANVKSVFSSIKTLITQVGTIFKGIYAVAAQAVENIRNFDFFDKEGKLQEKIDEMNGNFDKLEKDWQQLEKDVKKLSDDITAELPDDGDDGRVSGGISAAASGDVFDIIAAGEGDYNSVNQGTAGDTPGGAISVVGKNLTDMTVGEVMAAQDSGQLFAVGKYQIIPKTMKGFVQNSPDPIDMNDKFDSTTQEKFKKYVIDVKRPAVGRYIRGESDDRTEAAQELAREFASVGLAAPEAGRQRGESRYSGTGGNRASIAPEKIEGALDQARSTASGVKATTTAPGGVGPVLTPKQAISSPSLVDAKPGKGTLTSNYGVMRAGGPHGGTDIAAGSGTALTAVANGEIVDYGSLKESGAKRGDPSGWGNFLVYRDDKNYFHLYGHLLNGFKKSGSVKKGETIAKVGSTGRSSGPHLHWELGTSWTGGLLTGKMDPLSVYGVQDPFSPTGAVSTDSAQTPSLAPQQARSRSISRTMEQRNGLGAVVIGTPKMQPAVQPAASGGGGSPRVIRSGGTNAVAVLNSISRVILAYT